MFSDQLLALARAAGAPGWWQQYSDVLPRWLQAVTGAASKDMLSALLKQA